MGGYGNGRWGWGQSKLTVEDCLTLSLSHLARDKLLVPGYSGNIIWRNTGTGEITSRIGLAVEGGENAGLQLRLKYVVSGEDYERDIEEEITLQPTYPHFGGVRWWFLCPLVRGYVHCGRRVAKLYLPSGGYYFGCRHCYDLTYESCKRSHTFDRLFRMIGRNTGLSPDEVKRALAD